MARVGVGGAQVSPRKPNKGRRADPKTGRTTGGEPFVRLLRFMLKSPAWQSLNCVERALMIEVMQRWSGFNNGTIDFGVVDAGRALHVKPHTAGKAFHVLVEKGFLIKARDSSFSQKKLTREWQVTCLPMGDVRAPTSPPSHAYMHWRAPPTEAERPRVKKQKPLPFGDKHSAVSGMHVAELVQCNAPTVAPNGTMAESHSAVSVQASISMAGDTPRKPRSREAPPASEPSPQKKTARLAAAEGPGRDDPSHPARTKPAAVRVRLAKGARPRAAST